jgi:hypothetical protein
MRVTAELNIHLEDPVSKKKLSDESLTIPTSVVGLQLPNL